jgi:GGDEF domain-containing protein
MEGETWYLQHKPRIMRDVRLAIPHFRKLVVKTYGKDAGEAVAKETMQRFEALLPDIPYVGGDENRLTTNLYMTGAMLAMYQALQADCCSSVCASSSGSGSRGARVHTSCAVVAAPTLDRAFDRWCLTVE